MGTGKGWSDVENLLAFKAFVEASQDSKRGNGQKMDVFETRVASMFQNVVSVHQNRNKEALVQLRVGSSVSQRFKRIKKICIVFEGHYQNLDSLQLTGNPTETDFLPATTAAYNGRLDLGGDKKTIYGYFGDDAANPGTAFLFLNCYLWLRDTDFWRLMTAAIATSRTRKEDKNMCGKDIIENVAVIDLDVNISRGSSGSAVIESSIPKGEESESKSAVRVTPSKRPEGTKKAIEKLHVNAALNRGAQAIESLVRQSEKRNIISSQSLAVQERNSSISLFTMPGTDPEVFRRFMEIQQAVLKQLEKGGPTSPSIPEKRDY